MEAELPPELDSRLEKIETRLAYLEEFLIRLQDEVTKRHLFIDKLAEEHGAVKEKLLQISRDLEEIPNQRPPHY
jgi:SlyX protein